jgi:hypothetical protein
VALAATIVLAAASVQHVPAVVIRGSLLAVEYILRLSIPAALFASGTIHSRRES